MTVLEIAKALDFEILAGKDALTREVKCIFCCDLLSFVMGRAPADSAWVTVMGNINAIAVAALADTACIILAENAEIEEKAVERAEQQDIAFLKTAMPIYDAAKAVDRIAFSDGSSVEPNVL